MLLWVVKEGEVKGWMENGKNISMRDFYGRVGSFVAASIKGDVIEIVASKLLTILSLFPQAVGEPLVMKLDTEKKALLIFLDEKEVNNIDIERLSALDVNELEKSLNELVEERK